MAGGGLTSREKVLRLREQLLAMKPEDEEAAQMLQLLALASPMLLRALPDDYRQLDRFLEQIAVWCTECRSDDAPVLQLHVWSEKDERWLESIGAGR